MECRKHWRKEENRRKHWKVKRKKNEEYEESQITAIYIFGFKLCFTRKHNLKKKVFIPSNFIYSFYALQGIWNSNNAPKLNLLHKYTNYNIEIYINRLRTITQIFIAMDYLIMMSEKYLYCRKRKDHLTSNWIHVLWKYFSNYVFLKDIYKNLKEIGIIQTISKLIIFVNLWISKLRSSLH